MLPGGRQKADERHFLDVAPYPLHRPEGRELLDLLASTVYETDRIGRIVSTLGMSRGRLPFREAAETIWDQLLHDEAEANPAGGARPFIAQLVPVLDHMRLAHLAARLREYLSDAPPLPVSRPIVDPPVDVALEKALGMRDSLVDVVVLPRIVEAARAVVTITATFEDRRAYGSGFLVGPSRVLTNHHVLFSGAERASAVTIAFDYEVGTNGSTRAAAHRSIDVSTIVADEEDDVGVFDLNAPVEGRDALVLSAEPARAEQKVAIVQHPRGLPKKVAFHTVVAATEKFLHYLTDTDEGSSGSPVLDGDGRVVALHHGTTRVEVAGRFVPVNEGIAIERVRAAMKRLGVMP